MSQRKARSWETEHHLDEVLKLMILPKSWPQWTGIPVNQMLENETVRLLNMKNVCMKKLSGRMKRSSGRGCNPACPIGDERSETSDRFLYFYRTIRVGKTELAKALAEFMFDDEDALVRIDMSEYREQHTVSRLFGAPPDTLAMRKAVS